MLKVFRSREITNIYMKCTGLSEEEIRQILNMVRQMNRKRKRNKEPRLLYYIESDKKQQIVREFVSASKT